MKRCNISHDDDYEENSNLSFETPSNLPRLSTDISKCLKCQNSSSEKLSKASHDSILKFYEASEIRNDAIYHSLKPDKTLIFENEQTVVWHLSCYKEYTNKTKFERIQKKKGKIYQNEKKEQDKSIDKEANDSKLSEKVTRSTVQPINWNRCMFCQNITKLRDKTLHQILTLSACKQIEHAARIRNDKELLKITGTDLIAQEAKYHKQCHSIYTSKSNLKYAEEVKDNEEDIQFECQLSEGFMQLVKGIDFELFHQKKALNMSVLTERFRFILSDQVPNIENYRTEKLKCRLKNYFGDYHNYP